MSQPRRSVLGRVLYGLSSIVLVLISAFFLFIVAYLVSSEVMPVARQGSLNVETSTMILNRVWKGNEIYLLLAAYLMLACVSTWGAIRTGTKAIRG